MLKQSWFGTERSDISNRIRIKSEQVSTVKFQEFGPSDFCSKSHFEEDGAQNYLVFSFIKYFNV